MLDATRNTKHVSASASAFTLIELMVVIGIMGLVLAAGIPSLYKLMQKDGMRKVTSNVLEVCGKARAQAILRGAPVDVMFYPLERRLTISGGAPVRTADADYETVERPPPVAGQSAVIPEDFTIEMLDVNLSDYTQSEWTRVRFYPNGTSDELTLILRSPKNEWKKISTEAMTGLATPDNVTP